VLKAAGKNLDSATSHLFDTKEYTAADAYKETFVENDRKAMPPERVTEMLNFLGYASDERVMFRMLQITGCRIQELDQMTRAYLQGDILYWPLGKNQHSWRKEKLPEDYLEELRVYWERRGCPANKFFAVAAETFRGYFKHFVRHQLSPAWQERRRVATNAGFTFEYVLQLKGLRKSYQTMVFAEELRRWKDPGVALEFTSKRMKHSSTRITAYHYIQNFEDLGISPKGTISTAQPNAETPEHDLEE
jgi:integrase